MVAAWERSAHFLSVDTLSSSEESKKMAAILGYEPAEIPTKASCVRCHYTPEMMSGVLQTTIAVSCESCHTEAAPLIEEHNRKGVSRQSRIDTSLELGMAHPASVNAISKSCYECHVIDDEQLVNQAGHPAVSEGFEILSWYSGEVNHNFLIERGSGLKKHANDLQPISQERRRMLYLNGKLLHLGYLLRGLSSAEDAPVDRKGKFLTLENGKYTYAVQLARELKRIETDMDRIIHRVSIPQYVEALALLRSLVLETGNGRELREASEELFRLSEDFCQKYGGAEFGAIDPILGKLDPRYSEKSLR